MQMTQRESSTMKLMRSLFEIKRLYLNVLALLIFYATVSLMLTAFEVFRPVVAADPFKAFVLIFALWVMAVVLAVFFYFGEGIFLAAMALAASSLLFTPAMLIASVIIGCAGGGVAVIWRYFRAMELKKRGEVANP